MKFRERWPRSWLTYVFICIFGIGSWIAINGIWAEISVLVNTTPECEKLPAVLVVIIQLANLGPLLYGCLKYFIHCCKLQGYRMHLERGAILVLILIGIAACILLSVLWNRTSVIVNAEHSIALFLLTFFLALVDCTSSVLFVPFMKHFSAKYMSALYIGEGLSGVLPSLFAFSQGSVSNNYSCSGNYTSYKDLGIRFSPSVYFILLCAMMLLCGFAFVAIITFPAIRKHMIDTYQGSINFNKSADNHATFQRCFEEDNELHKRFSCNAMYKIIKSNLVVYSCLIIISFLTNGALSAITPFAFLRYGNSVYHIAINIALLINPLMSLVYHILPSKSSLITAINTAIASIMGIYVIVMAQSPYPAFQMLFIAKFLVVSAYIAMSGIVSYTKLSVAVQLHHTDNNDAALFIAGAVTQLGSLMGAVLFFFLVYYTNIYG